MKTNRRLRSLPLGSLTAAALLLAGAALPARASAGLLTIDQQNTASTGTVILSPPTGANGYGQSFTPQAPTLNAATFRLNVTGFAGIQPPPDGHPGSAGLTPAGVTTLSLRVDLFVGTGYSGTLLASSAVVAVTSTTPVTTEFDFAAPVALTIGNVYSFRVTEISMTDPNSTYDIGNSGNTYGSGAQLDTVGNPTIGNDLTFAEGTAAGAVPEPSTWALLGLGVCGLGLTLHRRRAVLPG